MTITSNRSKPNFCTEKQLERYVSYLNNLIEDAPQLNIRGSVSFIKKELGLSETDAKRLLFYWRPSVMPIDWK